MNAGGAVFKGMGRDIAYLPTYYVNEKLEPAGHAFILGKDGRVRYLTPQAASPISLSLHATTRRAAAQTTDGVAPVLLKEDREYELFYWDDEWISLGKKTASTERLAFRGVPFGGL